MHLSIRRFPVLLALLVSAVSTAALADTVLSVDSSASKLQYTIVHKLHTVEGVSKKVEGKALIKSDGTVLVQVVAPVTSFVSGSSGRDEHMQETMEAPKYPNVSFKARTQITVPTSFPATVKANLSGELDFHGRRHPETVPVEVTFNSATDVHVIGTFSVSLDKYEVERPSLLAMKINDDCKVDVDLALKQ